MTRDDINLYYFTLQPTSHMGFIACVSFSKLSLKINLFMLNDEFVAKQDKDWSQDNSPIGAEIERNANDHQKKPEINWIA